MARKTIAVYWLYMLCSLALQLSGISAGNMSMNFTKFNDSCIDLLYLVDDARISGNVIALTNKTKFSTSCQVLASGGRAVYRRSIPLWDNSTNGEINFSTHFQFVMEKGDKPHGEGIAFLFAFPKCSKRIPDGSGGGGLSVFTHDDLGPLPNSSDQVVAVEFDTYQNLWDKNDNHVGINVGTIIPVAEVFPSRRLNDGKIWDAWIDYSTRLKTLEVFLSTRSLPVLSHNIDLRAYLGENVMIGFSASTYNSTETHQIISWSFSITNSVTEQFSLAYSVALVVIIFVSVSSGMAIIICFRTSIFRWSTKASMQIEEQLNVRCNVDGPHKFTYSELRAATKNFSETQKLGCGGFGEVYKGLLVKTNEIVAVKRISEGSRQGEKEYISEISIISRLRHRNLVQLLGWCHEKKQLLLVYEYMANGSLDNLLFGERRGELDWARRHGIACDIASSLVYLHELCDECVVHRDVKPSNVILDSKFTAKLGDFGMARLVKHQQLSHTTTIAGTLGYMAPECAVSGKTSAESDVFGFGAVALEIACGRRAVNCTWEDYNMRLVEWVWDLYGQDRLLEAADNCLRGEFDKVEMKQLLVIGLWCSHPDPTSRPRMRQVLRILNFEAHVPSLPGHLPEPNYSPFRDEFLIERLSTSDCSTPPMISL